MSWDSSETEPVRPHVLLYSGPNCSLCERAYRILDRLAREGLLTWEWVDIATDPALVDRYGTRIPVLILPTGDTFEGRISEYRVRKALARPA